MKSLLLATVLLGTLNSYGSSLFTYTVVTKLDLVAECSDFLGKTFVGRDAYLRDFLIKATIQTGCPLEVDGLLKMTRGSIQNENSYSCARASTAGIQDAGLTSVISYPIDVNDLTGQMDFISNKLANTKSDSGKIVVRNLTQRDLLEGSSIVLETNGSESLVINFGGNEVSMKKINIILKGKANPSNIIWNFHEAQSIEIKLSGVKEANGVNIGIPGTIIAPHASVKMNNALVTGAIYSSSFLGQANQGACNDLVSGQVNPACFTSPALRMGCIPVRRGGKGSL